MNNDFDVAHLITGCKVSPAQLVRDAIDAAAIRQMEAIATSSDGLAGLRMMENYSLIGLHFRTREFDFADAAITAFSVCKGCGLNDVCAAALLRNCATAKVRLRTFGRNLDFRSLYFHAFACRDADTTGRCQVDVSMVSLHNDVAASRDKFHTELVREQT
jgi:hypothetical protein